MGEQLGIQRADERDLHEDVDRGHRSRSRGSPPGAGASGHGLAAELDRLFEPSSENAMPRGQGQHDDLELRPADEEPPSVA